MRLLAPVVPACFTACEREGASTVTRGRDATTARRRCVSELPSRQAYTFVVPSKSAGQSPPPVRQRPGDALCDAPLDSDAARLRMALARLTRRLRRPGLGELTPSQLSALATISKRMPVRLCDLAAREGVSASTLSRLVDHLEERGMVSRVRDSRDARSSQVSVTAEGARLLEDLRRNGTNLILHALQSLPGAERTAVLAALPALEKLADEAESTDGDGPGEPPRKR
jgi:DNA-binding MarR family transcriptional regulator